MEKKFDLVSDLNDKVMQYAYDVGMLRGTLKYILSNHSSVLPKDAIKNIEDVLKKTD